MEYALAARNVAEKQVVALTEDLSGVKTTHVLELHVRDAELNALKV